MVSSNSENGEVRELLHDKVSLFCHRFDDTGSQLTCSMQMTAGCTGLKGRLPVSNGEREQEDRPDFKTGPAPVLTAPP